MADDGPWVVVGLGNPGPAYVANRHNAGALVLDVLADRMGSTFKAHKTRNDVIEGRLGDRRLVLSRPRCYMNDSGGPVAAVRDFYKAPLDRLVVVHDELDLPFATLRLKLGGGDNGHNGLKSLRRSLGSGDFYRVRVGIGRPPGRQDPADWVLKDFSKAEEKELDLLFERAADAVEALISDGLPAAQNTYNT
ncbi:MAG TPA: aminoacyl-tRNA hydrolase [Mycobacteriales bacterium]|nr:aminoacyl-tRNA hydrolase [Mycobacteriales bacterium]